MPVGRSAPPKYSRNWTMVAACASPRCSPLGHRDDLRSLGPSSPSRGELPLIEGPVTKDEVPLLARVALVEDAPGASAPEEGQGAVEVGLARVEERFGPVHDQQVDVAVRLIRIAEWPAAPVAAARRVESRPHHGDCAGAAACGQEVSETGAQPGLPPDGGEERHLALEEVAIQVLRGEG